MPSRARTWRLRTRRLDFGQVPSLMGVVNVTPDSFSDGGRFLEPAVAVDHGLRLAEEGAAVLDIGGQSTRPGASPVDPDEELRRVLPVVVQLCRQASVPVSIDTSSAQVARAALDAGAEIVNDVTGLTGDPEMVDLVVAQQPGVCVMHLQGTPRSMQDSPTYENVVEEIFAYLGKRRDALTAAGLDPSRIALDPGIGFGKTTEHNLTLLRQIGRFHDLGCPLLVGPSRKRFIGQVLDNPDLPRDAGTLGVVLTLARRGVQLVRVHDVAPARQALALFAASGGLD
ncbi:MAG: dihydropteroate synthase [Pirellulales bacterium]|nr:dihydropteroate synthase [Pirellulales bacterium]